MSYDQSNPRRDDEYNSPIADDNYASRNTNVQSQNHRASSDDNNTSHFDSGVNEEVRKNSEPSDAPGYAGEDSMNTGPIRYESYMPGPGDEPQNDSTSSRDITSSRDGDLYEDYDDGAGRGAEAQRYDASNDTGNANFGTGDIGQPISNGYDSGSASWAREHSVSDDSRSASKGYAGDSSSSSAADTSAVGVSRNDADDMGGGDRSIGMDSKDSGVRSTSDDTRDRNNAGGHDESARSATASTFEEATTGNKSTDNTGSVGDNSTYKSSDPAGAEPHASRQSADERTDNDYRSSPYDATGARHDSQTTSSDGQPSLSQRDSSTLDDDRQGQDAISDTSKMSREDVGNTGAKTFDVPPGPNEDQTSREGLQQDHYMTPDTSDQGRSSTANYGKSPYSTTNSIHDSWTSSSDGRPSTIQRDSSALHDDQQSKDATTTKTPKSDLDNKVASTFDDQTSPRSGIRSTRDDAGDRESDDQLKEGVDAPEAPSGYRADKTGSIEDSDLGIDAPVSNDNTGDGSGGREDGSAQSHRDDNVRPDSHTTPDAQPLPSEETSSTLNDKQQGEVTTSAPRADMDNGGSSSFDDQPSVGEYHSPDDSQQYRDTTDTTGKGPGSRDDNSDHGGLRHEGSYRGSSQGQDASSNINAPTEDVDNSNFDKQNKDKQTGSDTASDTSGQDVGSKREDTSNTSDRSTSGADQPPDTIRYSSEREDNKPYVDDRAGAGAGAGYDHSGYGGYAASTGYRVGGKPGLKDKLRGNAEVLVGRAAKKPELVERGLERKAGNVV